MASKKQFGKDRKSKRPHPWAVPAWFRRQLNRELRAKRKQALKRGEDPDAVPQRDAKWNWW